MKCIYCNRESTHYYLDKYLCTWHYLQENPDRNKSLVDWENITRMGSSSFFVTAKELLKNGWVKND